MEFPKKVDVLLGAQWGDEGKGKWIDIIAPKYACVARFQGGNNAGHTLYSEGKKIVLHQIPSAALHGQTIAHLGAGVVINPAELVKELRNLKDYRKFTSQDLWISSRAHVITPWHIFVDEQREANSSTLIGTTKRGIGPTYAEKAYRTGLRMGEYVNSLERQRWIGEMSKDFPEFAEILQNRKEAWDHFHAAAEELSGFTCDGDRAVRELIQEGKEVLLEGAQGVLLDVSHGTYPFVTSSSTLVGGALSSIGIPAQSIRHVYGVAKAYTTRVGAGPFPTELKDEVGQYIAKQGAEFGATTGRPRRCGWLDVVALKHAIEINGIDKLILNKTDILSGLSEVKFASAYRIGTKSTPVFPAATHELNFVEPVYQSFRGWEDDITRVTHFSKLPAACQEYLCAIEESLGQKIYWIGNGQNRSSMIER